ncbi:MAG: hypothetical protein ACFBSE_01410 [Prochloraceae cyanobacterium]
MDKRIEGDRVRESFAERIESLKAGIIGAISFGIAYGITVASNLYILENTNIVELNLLLRLGAAIFSGFLFGVTYRYIIRTDTNSHLSDGAVFAFSLVRSLALLELSENLRSNLYILMVLSIESILCFALARVTLDLALDRKWVKPFKGG